MAIEVKFPFLILLVIPVLFFVFLYIRKNRKKEYVVTPIKKRVEDGKLFKFLSVGDGSGRLYDVGLALDSLIKNN